MPGTDFGQDGIPCLRCVTNIHRDPLHVECVDEPHTSPRRCILCTSESKECCPVSPPKNLTVPVDCKLLSRLSQVPEGFRGVAQVIWQHWHTHRGFFSSLCADRETVGDDIRQWDDTFCDRAVVAGEAIALGTVAELALDRATTYSASPGQGNQSDEKDMTVLAFAEQVAIRKATFLAAVRPLVGPQDMGSIERR